MTIITIITREGFVQDVVDHYTKYWNSVTLQKRLVGPSDETKSPDIGMTEKPEVEASTPTNTEGLSCHIISFWP